MFISVNIKCKYISLLAKTDPKKNELIKQEFLEEILLWTGKCVINELIPSPPFYFIHGRCSKNEEFDFWNDLE